MSQFLIFADGQVLFDPDGRLDPNDSWTSPCRKMTPDEIERYKKGERVEFLVPIGSKAVH